MRVANWREKEVGTLITDQALRNAKAVMDDVVAAARARCPVGTITRAGKWVTRQIEFTARKGKHFTHVRFTGNVWTGREPGMLRDTIRRADGRGKRRGNLRVYAGYSRQDPRVIWAHMVERGTVKMAARPFLRPAFYAIMPQIANRIKNG